MKKRFLSISAALILLCSLFSGCGDSNPAPTGGDGEPTYGGEVTVAILNDLDSLDPFIAQAAGTREVFFNIYEGLVTYSPEGSILPAVAETFSMADDAMSYTFTLRSGILFHSGEQVTPEDVKWSLERAVEADPKTFAGVSAIDIGGRDIIIRLSAPNNDLLPFLSAANAAIVPAGYTGLATMPIGTGPFKFVSYSPQQSLVAEKFYDYWKEGAPYLDKVTFKIMSDQNAAFLELLAGTIDVYPALETIYENQLKDDFNVTLSYRNIVQLLALNNARAPFDDVRVRQALCYLVDVEQIIGLISNGFGVPAASGLLPGFTKYYNESLNGAYKVDVEKAKGLLSGAGYPNGFDMTITVPNNYKFHVDTAQLIVEQLAAGGVNASIEQVEWGAWLERVYGGHDYDGTVIGLDGELSPKKWLGRYAGDGNNFMSFDNAEYNDLYAKAISELDDEKRVEYYKELQKILSDEAAAVYIQDMQFLSVLRKPLAGFTPYPIYVTDMSTIYYAE